MYFRTQIVIGSQEHAILLPPISREQKTKNLPHLHIETPMNTLSDDLCRTSELTNLLLFVDGAYPHSMGQKHLVWKPRAHSMYRFL